MGYDILEYIYISNFKVVYEYVILYLYLIYKMNKK